jgi:hypothetical protein
MNRKEGAGKEVEPLKKEASKLNICVLNRVKGFGKTILIDTSTSR